MFPVDFPLNILNQSIDYLTSSHLHCRSSAKSHPSRDVFAFHSVECSAFAALAVRAMGQNGRRSHRGLYAVKDVIFWHFWGPNFCLNSYLASIFLCSMLEHLLETIGNSLETDCHQLSTPDRPHGTAGRRFLQFCAKLQTVGWSLCSVSRIWRNFQFNLHLAEIGGTKHQPFGPFLEWQKSLI